MIWQLTDDKRWSALRQRFSWVEEMHHTPQDPEHHGCLLYTSDAADE